MKREAAELDRSHPGNDLTWCFPLIVESIARLRSRSCIIDGEAACDNRSVSRESCQARSSPHAPASRNSLQTEKRGSLRVLLTVEEGKAPVCLQQG
jgi:hypothetical protein